ncbi:MAG: FAD-dependent oxidoreductase, partial [Gemmatimonadales bacterium]
AGAEGGRSINLAISARGLHALDRAGIAERILELAIPMKGRMIHSSEGALTFQPYGASGYAINSVSRADLNISLLNAAEKESGVRLHFGQRCRRVDLEHRELLIEDERTGDMRPVQAGTIVGADGAFSVVRTRMQRQDRFDYSQSYLSHGYKELFIPPGPGGTFQIEKHALHIWPRGGYMMIALPNRDGSFTCTLFWPFTGPGSFASVSSARDLIAFFTEHYPDVIAVMPGLTTDFFANPTSSLVTIRCAPWFVEDRAVLIGDASHAVVPFYGQGANAAFEDCVVLEECLRESPKDPATAFADFNHRRKEHADALADLAIANFEEMRDKVASPLFLAGKKAEAALHRWFPDWFIPLYTMISFMRVPYADAVRRARRQWMIVGAAAGAVLAILVLLVAALL